MAIEGVPTKIHTDENGEKWLPVARVQEWLDQAFHNRYTALVYPGAPDLTDEQRGDLNSRAVAAMCFRSNTAEDFYVPEPGDAS